MSEKPPTDAAKLDHLRRSLVDHALGQIRRAARSDEDLGTLAFVGLAASLDTVARLWAPSGMNGKDAWMHFVGRYMPQRREHHAILYEGWRCRLLHEYGTGRVILQRGEDSSHFTVRDGSLVLVLELLIAEAHAALDGMLADAKGNAVLRRRVLSRAQRLLAPLKPQIRSDDPLGRVSALAASGSPTGMAGQSTAWGARDFPRK
jgi:hypothetical protein